MLMLDKGKYFGNIGRRYRLDGLAVVDVVYRQPVYSGWHAHEQAHLTLVLNGGNRERRSKTETQLRCGQVVFYRNHEHHRNDHTVFPSRNINIEISQGFFNYSGISETDLELAVHQQRLNAADVVKILKEISVDENHAAGNVAMLLAASTIKKRSQHLPAWVVQIKELLHDQWTDFPNLHDLSTAVGVHSTTISKYFTAYFGCTLGAYLRRLKIERALVMLRESQYSLTEIGHICGFSDQSHFIRTFKSETGFLPKSFRRY
jgi:AraC family transcriptional regulator